MDVIECITTTAFVGGKCQHMSVVINCKIVMKLDTDQKHCHSALYCFMSFQLNTVDLSYTMPTRLPSWTHLVFSKFHVVVIFV